MIDPGLMRTQVQIQAGTKTGDSRGGYTISWATITDGTIWARKRIMSGAEAVNAQTIHGRVDTRWDTWYLSTVTTAHTMLDDASVRQDIVAAYDPTGEREMLVIYTRRQGGVSGG